MGGIATVAVTIGSAIATAVSAAVTVIATVVSTIGSIVASIAGAIGAAVGAVMGAVTQTVSAIASAVTIGSASMAAAITNPIAAFAGTIFEYAHAIYVGVQALTSALHLKAIMRIHSVAYILSDDYRKMVKRVYGSIADMGEAIGASRDGIILAFRQAETLVKHCAAVMGRSYDLADVTWLKTLKGYLKNAEGRIKNMRNGLEDIIPDIEEHVIKPAIDALAEMQKTWFSLLESMGESIDSVFGEIAGLFESVDTVRSDLNNLVDVLPGFIEDKVRPWIDEINEGFTYFIEDYYQPFKDNTQNLINMLQGKQAQQRQEVDGIIDRLLRPGDLIKSIDDLTKDTRIDQENKVGEIASRPMERESKELEDQAAATFEHLEKIRTILEEEPPAPEWKIEERPEPVIPKGGQSAITDTWYVGDY